MHSYQTKKQFILDHEKHLVTEDKVRATTGLFLPQCPPLSIQTNVPVSRELKQLFAEKGQ